ncbi:MAG TPA: hypothetical protein DCZ08_03490 [Anaerolineaceae bacterium]|nr:hypothetical protein [Anaerolineaceae bacterium]
MKNLTEQELLAQLRFAVDQVTLEQAKKAVEAIDKGLIKTSMSTEDARRRLMAMRESAEKLQQVGSTLAMASAAIVAPLLLAVRSYNQYVGQGEATSRRWTESSERLKNAQIRIGRETTEAMLPLLDKGADLADKFAGLIEKNPDLLKGILTVGVGLAGAGTVVTMIAQVQRLIATVQLLAMGPVAGRGAGIAAKIAGSGLGAAAGLATGGIALGVTGYNAIAQATGRDSAGEILGKYQTSLAYMWGKMLGGPELAYKWGAAMGKLTGVLPEVADETEKASSALSKTAQAQMRAYLNYAKAEREATVEYRQRQVELSKNYLQQQAQAQAEYNRNQSQAMRAFYNLEKQAESDYYRSRMQAARAYGTEVARAEEDFQREMQRMQEDNSQTMEDLIGKRDALGLVQATREYERQRRRAEEDYTVEAARRSQDFAIQQAEQAAEFAAQREQRLAQFQQQMADNSAAYQEQRRQAEQQYRQQQAELTRQYNEDRVKRRQAMIDQLRDLADGLAKERELRAQFTQAMLADLRAAMSAAGVAIPTRHGGGYTGDGLYRMKRGEFVLRPDVTSAAERLAGKKLNQDNMLALLARGGAGGNNYNYVDNRRFDSRLSSEDRKAIRRDLAVQLGEVFGG